MARIFGTDGVRGLANGPAPGGVTAELALDLSVAAAKVILDTGDVEPSRPRPLAVVGRDTRISGQFLEHAVVAGLASAGVDVLRLRVLPTPGVAYLTQALDRGPTTGSSSSPVAVSSSTTRSRRRSRRAWARSGSGPWVPTSAGSGRTTARSMSTSTTWSALSTYRWLG
jgi:hypothetical protein